MMKMYIITHKKFDVPPLEGYVPLQVGASGKENLGYLCDNTGENISEKNPYYCELTGVFWIWKNITDLEHVGICHYRRYFSDSLFALSKSHRMTIKKMENYLSNYDIILPKKEVLKESAWQEYFMVSGKEKDLITVKEIIAKDFPKMLPAFESYFNQNKSHLYNMMVCSKSLYDEYCEFLFSVLGQLEQTVNYGEYNDYQKRIYGFMSERLLNVWVEYKKLRVKEVTVVNMDMGILEYLRIALRRVKNRVIFKMHKDTSVD